jgi:hypothetical protein
MENKKTKRSTASKGRKKTTNKKVSKSDPLSNIQQTTGKVYEYDVNQVRKLEEILETRKTNPVGTNDSRIFKENLASMNLSDMQEIAVRCGVFPNGNKTILKNKLLKAFSAEGFGVISSVVESDSQVKLDPKNKSHKEIIDYLNS